MLKKSTMSVLVKLKNHCDLNEIKQAIAAAGLNFRVKDDYIELLSKSRELIQNLCHECDRTLEFEINEPINGVITKQDIIKFANNFHIPHELLSYYFSTLDITDNVIFHENLGLDIDFHINNEPKIFVNYLKTNIFNGFYGALENNVEPSYKTIKLLTDATRMNPLYFWQNISLNDLKAKWSKSIAKFKEYTTFDKPLYQNGDWYCESSYGNSPLEHAVKTLNYFGYYPLFEKIDAFTTSRGNEYIFKDDDYYVVILETKPKYYAITMFIDNDFNPFEINLL